MIMLVVCGR